MRGEGGREGRFQTKKKQQNMYSLLVLSIKFQVPSPGGHLVLTQTKGVNGQVRVITLPMFHRIQLKVILTLILNNILNFRILT